MTNEQLEQLRALVAAGETITALLARIDALEAVARAARELRDAESSPWPEGNSAQLQRDAALDAATSALDAALAALEATDA